MVIVRLLVFTFMFLIILITYGSAGIESWLDENGVRHFINVYSSQKSGEVKAHEEYKSSETEKNPAATKKRPRSTEKKWNSYEEICRADPSCNKEMEKRKQYEEDQKLKEQHRQKIMQKVKEENKKRKEQICERLRKELDRFRQAGWENYNSPKLPHIPCPDRFWSNSRGERFDNRSECIGRRNRYKKSAYEQELRHKEYMIRSCDS